MLVLPVTASCRSTSAPPVLLTYLVPNLCSAQGHQKIRQGKDTHRHTEHNSTLQLQSASNVSHNAEA